jgi:hypothetical protein
LSAHGGISQSAELNTWRLTLVAKDRHKDSIVISVRVKLSKKAAWKRVAGNTALSKFIEDAVDDYMEDIGERQGNGEEDLPGVSA